jgi:hypothetical protein
MNICVNSHYLVGTKGVNIFSPSLEPLGTKDCPRSQFVAHSPHSLAGSSQGPGGGSEENHPPEKTEVYVHRTNKLMHLSYCGVQYNLEQVLRTSKSQIGIGGTYRALLYVSPICCSCSAVSGKGRASGDTFVGIWLSTSRYLGINWGHKNTVKVMFF